MKTSAELSDNCDDGLIRISWKSGLSMRPGLAMATPRFQSQSPNETDLAMAKQAIHRILELLVGLPLLVLGGTGIAADVRGYLWIQQDPSHRWGFVGPGTMLGFLPFAAGCWLVSRAIIRMRPRGSVKPSTSTPVDPAESN